MTDFFDLGSPSIPKVIKSEVIPSELEPQAVGPLETSDEEKLPRSIPKGKWVAKFEAPKGIGLESFRHVVSAAYTAYIGVQGIPSVDDVHQYVTKNITKAKISEVMLTDEFKVAIESRGIQWRDFNGISASQQYAISILTNPTDRRELRKKLASAGVTYAQYRAWLKQPTFARYFNNLTEGLLSDHIGDLHTTLVNKGLNGDLNAIKYIHELNGRHDPNQQQVADMKVVIESLIEIVTRNVTDQETLQKIATEMQMVINGKPSIVKGQISGN